MTWDVVTRVGDRDSFAPPDSTARIFVDLRRTEVAPDRLGPDVLAAIAKVVGRLPSTAACDFLSIAKAAFAADIRIPRNLGEDRWTRDIRLFVPVTEPVLWSGLAPKLEELLSFLTGDEWRVVFRQLGSVPAYQMGTVRPAVGTVCLFSGGLDSLIGAIDLLTTGEAIALVGQYGSGLTNTFQTKVAARLKEKFGNKALPLTFAVQPPKKRSTGEPTMRARSILFFGLGVAVASALDARRLVVAENGLISLNVPLTLARQGSSSTRTTHPHVIAVVREIVRAIGIDVAIELPYRFQTKGEMVAGCKDPEMLVAAAPLTMSCSHPEVGRYLGRRPGKHCGYCVPCIIRRAAFNRAGWPHGEYEKDILRQAGTLTQITRADLRAFAMAAERFKDCSKLERTAHVTSTGPIPAEDIGQYAETYARGMEEISRLISPVT